MEGIFCPEGFLADRALVGPCFQVDEPVSTQRITGWEGFRAESALVERPLRVYLPMASEGVSVSEGFPANGALVALLPHVQLMMSIEAAPGSECLAAKRANMQTGLLILMGFLMLSESVSVRKGFPTNGTFVRLGFYSGWQASMEDTFSAEPFRTARAFVQTTFSFDTAFLIVWEGPCTGKTFLTTGTFGGSAFWVDSLMSPEVVVGRVDSLAT